MVSGLGGGRVGGGGGGPLVSSLGWPLGDRNLASETALPERERERQRDREREREGKRERERDRQELGFCNRERARLRGRERGLGVGPAPWEGRTSGLRVEGAGPSLSPGRPLGEGGGPGEEGGGARERALPRERAQRERERERARTERGLRALTGTGGGSYRTGALTGKKLGELFSGALQETPLIAPGRLHKKMFIELFW